MLDLTVYRKRYYDVKLDENLIVNIEPPKKKQLQKILSLTKSVKKKELTEEDIDNMYEAAEIAISKNKEGKKFTADQIEDYFPLDAIIAFFDEYYTWVTENMNQKN